MTIHGTEIDLIAKGERICPAEPDVGIMRRYVDGLTFLWADGTEVSEWWCLQVPAEECAKAQEALNVALAAGEFDPDPDFLRERREDGKL